MAEPDLVSILLRSLPDSVKGFVVHHSDGESYTSYRNAAQRWERQQRMFSDLGVSGKKQFYQLENPSSPETYDLTEYDDDMISAMSGACNTCGSRKHSTEQCTADISKNQMLSVVTSTDIYPKIAQRSPEDQMAKVPARDQRV